MVLGYSHCTKPHSGGTQIWGWLFSINLSKEEPDLGFERMKKFFTGDCSGASCVALTETAQVGEANKKKHWTSSSWRTRRIGLVALATSGDLLGMFRCVANQRAYVPDIIRRNGLTSRQNHDAAAKRLRDREQQARIGEEGAIRFHAVTPGMKVTAGHDVLGA
jgi:hypothetical protein